MRFSSIFLAITILAALSICGCHLIFPFETKSYESSLFEGKFRGPIKSDYTTGSAMWGDTLEVKLEIVEDIVPPGQTKKQLPLLAGTGNSFYANGQYKWSFQISGAVSEDKNTEGKNNVAKLTLTEAKTHKETKATATLKSPNYDTMDLNIEWPKGLTAKATLKKIPDKKQ